MKHFNHHHLRTLLKSGKKVTPRLAVGETPGMLRPGEDAAPPCIQVMGYNAQDCFEDTCCTAGQLSQHLERWDVCWIHVMGTGNVEVMNELGRVMGIHTLAMEDVVNAGQRTKLEEYENHLFLIAQMPKSAQCGQMDQLALFIGKNYVLTIQPHAHGDCFDPVRERIRMVRGRGRVRTMGSSYLAYCLLDCMVDHYVPMLEDYERQREEIEDELFMNSSLVTTARIQSLRRELRMALRAVQPLGLVISGLRTQGDGFVDEATHYYLRDLEDHVLRLINSIDVLLEMTTDLMDFYFSLESSKLNEIMRTLTMVATIFIPLSFIAGVYGMNFSPQASRWNMPELHWAWGYPAVLGLMALVAVGMLFYFKRRRWM